MPAMTQFLKKIFDMFKQIMLGETAGVTQG